VSTVHIRPYALGDDGALFDAARESIAEVYPWLPWCHADYTRDEATSWVEMQIERYRARAEFQFVIRSADDRFLGGCGLNGISDEQKLANLGYWVRSSATGSGAAPAAVRLVRRWAFENTDLERLEIVVAVENTKSTRVAEKAGAVLEGTLRARLRIHGRSHDAFMYTFVRADGAG
jgi:RimJ/RimL family protein N-acetyltransferase